MSKMIFKQGLGLLLVVSQTLAAQAAALGAVKQLHGHVPAAIANMTPVGNLERTNYLHLAIGLPLHNQAALNVLLQQISDPASPNYRHYLTPSEFAEQFGPTTNEVQEVQDFVKTNGLTVTVSHGSRMLVEVTGQVSDIDRAFNVKLKKYHHPNGNRDFFAPDQEPSVPVNLSVLDISGLNNYSRPHPFTKFKPFTANSNLVATLAGSAPDGTSYMGYDFRKAYVPGTTLTGAGQKIALVQFDSYFPSDIAMYQQLTGLPSISITNILLDGYNGVPTMSGGEVEVELDIEMVNSMAPGLSQLLVYEENPNIFNPVVVLSKIAMDNVAKQVSCSWSLGVAPSGSGTINQILQQMALQGQSFFQASGDSDALLPGEADDLNGFFGICCNPYLTSVGGTKLTTDVGGNYTSEMVWNDRTPNGGQGGDWGSGGGISDFYPTPSWQQGFGTSTNHGSTTGRNFPDVAFTATDVYVIVDNGLGGSSGGTSAAAPLWAAFTALINQQGAINGKPPVGFINPALYNLAKTSNYTNVFNDITVGDNTWPGSPTNFFAVPGYDLCTGLGTPKGTNLINALVGSTITNIIYTPIISAPQSPWGTNLAALNGDNPNGAWFLFAQDTSPLQAGVISNGWYVTLTTANPVGFAADNQIYATPTNLALTVGARWNFTLAVTNYGPSTSTNVYVTNNLPDGLILVTNTPTLGSVSKIGSRLTWSLGTLAANTGATLALSFLASSPGTYTNRAGVASDGTTDPNPDDDSVSVTVGVVSPTPPQLSAVAGFTAGTFHFTITNPSGQPYVVQASTNLQTWVPIYTNPAPPTTTSFIDVNATNFPYRFYRVLLQ